MKKWKLISYMLQGSADTWGVLMFMYAETMNRSSTKRECRLELQITQANVINKLSTFQDSRMEYPI